MKTRLIAFLLVLPLIFIGAAAPVSANVITHKDGNDTKGPLDLAGLKITHKSTAHIFQISTQGSFTNKEANGTNGFFELGIDTNADQHPNYYIDIFFAAGRFRGVLFKPNGTVITYNLKAARVSGKAVKVALPLSKIIQKGSYDVAVFSIYRDSPCTKKKPCVDAIPNRYPLIRHDWTPPTITWKTAPEVYESDTSPTLVIPMRFVVKENTYGSGLKNWVVQRRDVGTSTWIKVTSGITTTPLVNYLAVEGGSYDFRMIATDRQGNTSTSDVKRANVAWDDRNALFTYSASTQFGVGDAFLGTVSHVASGESVDVILPVAANDVCLLGGATTSGSVGVSVSNGGNEVLAFTEDTSTPVRTRFCLGYSVPSGYALHVTESSGAEPLVLDGLIVSR